MANTKSVKSTEPKDYGPLQFPDRLGIPVWAFECALWHQFEGRFTGQHAGRVDQWASRLLVVRSMTSGH
jgi:hypothetical protein